MGQVGILLALTQPEWHETVLTIWFWIFRLEQGTSNSPCANRYSFHWKEKSLLCETASLHYFFARVGQGTNLLSSSPDKPDCKCGRDNSARALLHWRGEGHRDVSKAESANGGSHPKHGLLQWGIPPFSLSLSQSSPSLWQLHAQAFPFWTRSFKAATARERHPSCLLPPNWFRPQVDPSWHSHVFDYCATVISTTLRFRSQKKLVAPLTPLLLGSYPRCVVIPWNTTLRVTATNADKQAATLRVSPATHRMEWIRGYFVYSCFRGNNHSEKSRSSLDVQMRGELFNSLLK